MTDEQHRDLLLMLDALRWAILATIPFEQWKCAPDELKASGSQAAAALGETAEQTVRKAEAAQEVTDLPPS